MPFVVLSERSLYPTLYVSVLILVAAPVAGTHYRRSIHLPDHYAHHGEFFHETPHSRNSVGSRNDTLSVPAPAFSRSCLRVCCTT